MMAVHHHRVPRLAEPGADDDDPAPISSCNDLPVRDSTVLAYALLWRHQFLHAKAIWPPVVFLVTAEFLYHRVIGNAHGLSAKWNAALSAPWFMLAGAALAWPVGLKLSGADPHAVPVALGESIFRQAMLFLHVSLGASIGAATYSATITGRRLALPEPQPHGTASTAAVRS